MGSRGPTPALELAPKDLYPNRMLLRRVKPHWPGIAILMLAALLRLWALDLKPAHFDEGVNGWFADQMSRTGYYRYDPTNYHGPLHMVAVFVSQTLLGRNLWALRLPAVLASLLAVWMLLRFREFFGSRAARIAALGMAVSPAFVFFGRYSIHESWLVFFLLMLLYGLLGLGERGERRYLWWALGGVTGAILTKETYAIHGACFFLALVTLRFWEKVMPSSPAFPIVTQRWNRNELIPAVAISAFTIVAFYSGFFFDFGAVSGLWETFAAWFKTGVEAGGHEKTGYQLGPLNYYFLELALRYEWAAFFGLLACLAYVGKSDGRVRYIAIYGGGAMVAYSLIPYKTPWCLISLLWPFYLVGGCFLARLRAIVSFPLVAATAVGGIVLATPLNFTNFDDDDEPYVYVQTYKEIDNAIGPLLMQAAKDPTTFNKSGVIVLSSYYPLPWILGDFTKVGYFELSNLPAQIDAAFVLTEADSSPDVESRLKGAYFRKGFKLRSGMGDCVAYFRADDFRDHFPGSPDLIGGVPNP